VAKLKFKPSGLLKLRKQGLVPGDRDLAKALQVDYTTVHRVLNGATKPGERFIAGVVYAFGPEWFASLFEAVPDDAA
jgi:hypothetical protein